MTGFTSFFQQVLSTRLSLLFPGSNHEKQKNQRSRSVEQMEDLAVPRLRLSPFERAVYSHLLRHSRLEGKAQIRFGIMRLSEAASLSDWAVRKAVRGLAAKGALRVAQRSKKGHVVEVRLPEEIRGVCAGSAATNGAVCVPSASNLEETSFWETPALREAIHAREGGRCFYCMRRVKPAVRCLDHVVPQVRGGSNSYRNLVSSCTECNSRKLDQRAEDFLRWLFREGQLTAAELKGRLRALEQLAAGKMRPTMEGKEEVRK
jgi:HNH endonuclease